MSMMFKPLTREQTQVYSEVWKYVELMEDVKNSDYALQTIKEIFETAKNRIAKMPEAESTTYLADLEKAMQHKTGMLEKHAAAADASSSKSNLFGSAPKETVAKPAEKTAASAAKSPAKK